MGLNLIRQAEGQLRRGLGEKISKTLREIRWIALGHTRLTTFDDIPGNWQNLGVFEKFTIRD